MTNNIEKMNEETSLLTFKTICNFIDDLSSEFEKKHHPLLLYKRLIGQTKISHEKSIRKHIAAHSVFCIANRDAIQTQDAKKLVEKKIAYSERVYIDMAKIFKLVENDPETTAVIWQHILTISALVDPAGKAKEILRKNMEDGKTEAPEVNFLTDIISKVEKSVKPDANPMEAISSMMQSGIFTDLLSSMQGGMESGKLDIGKLIGAVQTMVASMGNQSDPETKQTFGMLQNMVGTMQSNPGQPPNMTGMMAMMSAFMSTTTKENKNDQVEDITDGKQN